jgi:hypothetical protein
MPKSGSDANSRIFFDELVSLDAARLKATGAIRLEDRHGVIAFGNKQKLVGVSHTVFRNRGSWSYFICPRGGGRKKKLWLVDYAPRCLSCCWSLGVRYRSAYGFGRAERLRERDYYLERVHTRRLRGRPSAHLLWLKGRRVLLSRNDFNWQRVETATSQRCRNNCPTVEMENGAPANYLANRKAPHPGVSGGGGIASDLTG